MGSALVYLDFDPSLPYRWPRRACIRRGGVCRAHKTRPFAPTFGQQIQIPSRPRAPATAHAIDIGVRTKKRLSCEPNGPGSTQRGPCATPVAAPVHTLRPAVAATDDGRPR